MKPKTVVLGLGLLFLLEACASMTGGRAPRRIVMERGGFIPEGIEFDTLGGRFLTGSLVDGTVYEIGLDGSLVPFVVDAELVSSVGIEVDEPRNRLLVANADRSVFNSEGRGIAKLGVYLLSTGEKITMVDLGAVAGGDDDSVVFANDLTVDDQGNVYLTDTRMNVIYRVDQQYNATVLYRFEPMTGLGLNGIEFHPDGYLIVVAAGGQGMLYRVPIDNPSAASPVDLSQPATGADGLVWAADGRLIVISNSTSSATAYRSDDGWRTAELVGSSAFDGQATTGAVDGEDVYVVQPHFNDAEAPVILRVNL